MIRCTRHETWRTCFLILVAAFMLTGCTSIAPGMAGSHSTGEIVSSAAIAGGVPATEVMITPTYVASATSTPTAPPTYNLVATAAVQMTVTPSATVSQIPALPTVTHTSAPTATAAPSRTPTPVATATLESPAVVVKANANIRSGPSIAYPIIGAARVEQRLPVSGQADGWWQITFAERTGWIWDALVTPNVAAGQAPEVTDIPPPPSPTSLPPTIAPAAAPPPLSASAPHPDLVVLGPETQYPVRARVVRGWDYEFVDLSSQYDIVVYRDVFGMLAHQIDDENVRRYGRQSRFARSGPIRISLVDAQPHPDPACPGWGWAPDRDTFVDPYGMTQDPCRVEHSLFPQGDGAGTTLLIGWGYNAGTTLAVDSAGPFLANLSTSFLAETLPWPANLGPADRPDFSQPLYQPLGAAHKEDGLWVWTDAFAEIVPSGQ